MNSETGQIRLESQLTPKQKESGKFEQLTQAEFEEVRFMNRAERREWMKKNKKKP